MKRNEETLFSSLELLRILYLHDRVKFPDGSGKGAGSGGERISSKICGIYLRRCLWLGSSSIASCRIVFFRTPLWKAFKVVSQQH